MEVRIAVVFSAAMAVSAAHADNVTYYYDQLGRVIEQVNDTTSLATIYAYDAAGNITSTDVIALGGAASMSGFAPAQASAGTPVTIYGAGFSPKADNNAVTFNGIAAEVTSAVPTKLVVSVPAGATTGAVAVTVGLATVKSAQDFVVSPNRTPSISSFSPQLQDLGANVTVSGANFDAEKSRNKIRVNGSYAQIISATASSLTFTVPSQASPGPIRVGTMFGTAVSAGNLNIPPPGVPASDVSTYGPVGVNDDTGTNFAFTSSKKTILATFDGSQGARGVRVLVTAVGTTRVFDPSGNLIASSTSASSILDLPALPATGTYTVAVTDTRASGNVTVHVINAVVDAYGSLTGQLIFNLTSP